MNWDSARLRYETRPDCTQQDIADEMGCSRQAVQQRAKKDSWLKAEMPELVTELECTKPVAGSQLGKRSVENIGELVNVYALTGSLTMACDRVGIDPDTLLKWRDKEPELSVAMKSARIDHLIGQYSKIANAKDWKAAKEILARAPETKEQWGEVQEKGPVIILNIHRDEVVISS